jgi:hypothetical protein
MYPCTIRDGRGIAPSIGWVRLSQNNFGVRLRISCTLRERFSAK